MKVYLIRHGEKEKTAGDPPLSAIGRVQAQNTGKHLKNFEINKVLSSPLLRTKQTADLICKEIGLSYEVDENLRERMNWGDKPGQTFDDFLAEWTKATIDRDFVPSVGDSSRNAGLRLENVIKSQRDTNGVKNLILVTHGGIITDFVRNVFSEKELRIVFDSYSQDMESIIKECSVTVVDYSNEKFKLESLATIDHLAIDYTL